MKNVLIVAGKSDKKPMSVNECWQGRRFKTKKYKEYREYLQCTLPPCLSVPDKTPLMVVIEFWFSNSASDIDNPVKPVLDAIQDRYGINDKRVFKLEVEKKIVARWEDYFSYQIYTYPQGQRRKAK